MPPFPSRTPTADADRFELQFSAPVTISSTKFNGCEHVLDMTISPIIEYMQSARAK